MKKVFKLIGIIILLLLLVFLVLGLTQPKKVTVIRTKQIHAPQNVVFHQIVKFKNWPNWSPWIEIESNVKLSYQGIDGLAGSSYSWLGDETGSGQMTATRVTAEQLDYSLLFIEPWEGHASGSLNAQGMSSTETKVTWSMTMLTDFPMNAFNFFTERMIGKDFEHGLDLLKTYAETHPVIELGANSVTENQFPVTTYASVRNNIKWAEMQAFSTTAFNRLKTATENRRIGTAATFYYSWDDTAQSTDMAPAYAVSGTEPIKGLDMVTITGAYAFSILYKGGYGGLGSAHQILEQYVAERGRKVDYILEEYLVGPESEADSNKWVTNINFMVK